MDGAGRLADRPPIDQDRRADRVDRLADAGDLAVDGDPAGRDHPLSLSAGSNPSCGKDLLEALGGHQSAGRPGPTETGSTVSPAIAVGAPSSSISTRRPAICASSGGSSSRLVSPKRSRKW